MENHNYALVDVPDYGISYFHFLQFQINVSLVSFCLTGPRIAFTWLKNSLCSQLTGLLDYLFLLCLFLLSWEVNISCTSLSSEIQSSSCLSLHFLNFRIRVDFFSACLFIHEPTPPLCVSAFSIESFSSACNTHLILLLLTSSLLEKVTSWWHFAHRD